VVNRPDLPDGDRPILALVGPTASGKTALALEWAEALGTEIVSADSVQIHIGLDIGSAKPTAAELSRVPHAAISVLPPTERPSAGRWVELVTPTITRLHEQGRVPIVCGGTGLYVRSLLEGLADIPAVPEAVRSEIASRLERLGVEALHHELARVDAAAAERISPRDPQRITRALEVLAATGVPISTWQRETTRPPGYQATVVGLAVDRAVLTRRIAERAAQMVADGLIDEVVGLLATYPPDCPGLTTLGYREVVAAVRAGRPDRLALTARLAQAHRQYAKRQETWFARARVDRWLQA
jgi:tRNA dimethylallyltransferase